MHRRCRNRQREEEEEILPGGHEEGGYPESLRIHGRQSYIRGSEDHRAGSLKLYKGARECVLPFHDKGIYADIQGMDP